MARLWGLVGPIATLSIARSRKPTLNQDKKGVPKALPFFLSRMLIHHDLIDLVIYSLMFYRQFQRQV